MTDQQDLMALAMRWQAAADYLQDRFSDDISDAQQYVLRQCASEMKKRANQSGVSHITPVGGNVFSDLGFSKAEAAELQKHAREAAAKLGRAESTELSKEDVEAAEEAYREAIIGLEMKPPEWSSLAPMWHALRTFISRKPQLGPVDEPVAEITKYGYLNFLPHHKAKPGDKLYTRPQLPAVVPDVGLLDLIFNEEIKRVSTVEFDSNAICRKFYEELRKRLVEELAAPQPDNKESSDE